MRRLIALWRKETIALLRDHHGLAALFMMPVIFILVMTLALHDTFSPGATINVRYAVVDLDHSAHAQSLLRRLDKGGFKRVDAPATPEAARAAVRDGQLGLALILPAGFGERLLTPAGADGQPTTPLNLLLDPTLSPALQLAFRNQVAASLGALRADELTHRAGKLFGLPTSKNASERDWPDEIISEAIQNDRAIRPPSSVQQNVPAWLVFAMFFVVIPISALFVSERQQGTLQRLRAMGLPFSSVLIGKLAPYVVVNQIQAGLMVLVGMHVVPLFGGEALQMPAGASLLHWWLVALAVSLAAVASALVVATLAQTTQQAVVVGGVGNILMGAIGGIMVPKFMMPASMQKIAEFSPMAWGLEGFHSIMLRHAGLSVLLPILLQLVLFAMAALAVALWLYRRQNP